MLVIVFIQFAMSLSLNETRNSYLVSPPNPLQNRSDYSRAPSYMFGIINLSVNSLFDITGAGAIRRRRRIIPFIILTLFAIAFPLPANSNKIAIFFDYHQSE